MGVLPGARPFAADSGEGGVLRSRGVTGAPRSLRPRSQQPAAAGRSLRLPRPPGSLEFVRAHTSVPAAG